jgi:hypothetical protein
MVWPGILPAETDIASMVTAAATSGPIPRLNMELYISQKVKAIITADKNTTPFPGYSV